MMKKRLLAMLMALALILPVFTLGAAADDVESYPPFGYPPTVPDGYYVVKESRYYYENGKEILGSESTTDYTFYANGNEKTEKYVSVSADGTYKTVMELEYDEEGFILKQTSATYENGRLTSSDSMDYSSGTSDSTEFPEPTITTDSQGRITSVKFEDSEERMTYDAKGRQLTETHIENGSVVWKYTYSYDASDRISGFDYNSGNQKYRGTYQYVESGGTLRVTVAINNTTNGKNAPWNKTVTEYKKLGPTTTFTDVPLGEYYSTPVAWAASKGITNGTTATTFSPNSTCTRGQIVTFLWRANGKPEPKRNSNPFVDVSSGAYFYKAVLWAAEQGITLGVDATHFAPDAGCTRAQAVTFLWRAAGKPSTAGIQNPFTDVKSGQYYTDAVLWASATGVTKGTTTTTFSPDQTCLRGQIVTFLYRDMVR